MRRRALAVVALSAAAVAAAAIGCRLSDLSGGGGCGSGRCGYLDHRYDSIFYCPPRDLIPGGWSGYSWRDPSQCLGECAAAANWGCDASGCDASCEIDAGSGSWLPCDAANGGTQTASGCFLSGSGVSGETVPCVCR